MTHKDVIEIGEARMWIEQETSIHLKAVTKEGDPIELTSDEARLIASALEKLARRLEELDSYNGPYKST